MKIRRAALIVDLCRCVQVIGIGRVVAAVGAVRALIIVLFYIACNASAKPLAEEFFAWANSRSDILPKMPMGKAIKYANDQREWLDNFWLDGRLELSNNRAENAIRPFVIGRKNWLFCNSQKGAKASSVVYSIIETAKANGLKPFEYLNFLFEAMPNATTAQIVSLLPWSHAVPDSCKITK